MGFAETMNLEKKNLGFIFIPPVDSVVHQNLDRYIFDVINEEVDKMNNMAPILILRDWNARVGNLKEDMVKNIRINKY